MNADRPVCRLGETCETPEEVAEARRELGNILWPLTIELLHAPLRL